MKERIPFGQETKLEILTPTCPGCDAEHGQYHEYGCPLETCPACGRRLRECHCMVLSILDEFKITRAIAQTLTKEQVLAMAEQSENLDRTYLEKSAFTWIIQNAPPELQTKMEVMALDILGAEKHGNMIRVPAEKAAEAMGMTIEEAAPILEGLEAESLYPGWDQHTGREQ